MYILYLVVSFMIVVIGAVLIIIDATRVVFLFASILKTVLYFRRFPGEINQTRIITSPTVISFALTLTGMRVFI